MRRSAAILFTLGMAALAACSDQTSTGPAQATKSASTDPTPGDTTHSYSGSFDVHGQVVGVTVLTPSSGVQDTLNYTPLSGAKIRVIHNLLVNGEAKQELAAETVSDAQGSYAVSGLEGGYYIVEAEPPSGSQYAAAQEYLAGQSPEVTLNVYLWKQQ
ncbi:MAG TPA: prealbumin-like fold domain-containing protein [Gemmatimonadaceae bacterium]|jgi:hypothetical protein|nr:prealbumin-like fold domain-containing protein [Gemmatimonadaceae bacterium]